MAKDRQTILDAVRAWDGRSLLPDEDPEREKIRFSTGALDNVRLRHFGLLRKPKTADLFRALERGDRKKLYRLMVRLTAVDHVDALAEQVESSSLDREAVAEIARWLLLTAADRGPVKYALVLLGVAGAPRDAELVKTFARHDEFTMFAARAMERVSADPVAEWLAMAEQVHAWGKIALVERIAERGSDRPEVRDWLLRRGCKNAVMDEYLGYACATAGRLHEALAAETIDPGLRAGACTIVSALVIGGPAEDIKDYEHGVEVIEHLLRHLEGTTDLEELAVAGTIARWLSYEKDWSTAEVRERIAGKVRALLSGPGMEERLRAAFRGDDPGARWNAWGAAGQAGIDLWEDVFELVQREPLESYLWQWLVWTRQPARMQRAIALAERLLPLDEIATGPEDEMGLGEEFEAHMCLDMVLQELREKGLFSERLVSAALRNPVVRTRFRAIEVLQGTPRAQWGAEMEKVVARAAEEEPDEELEEQLRELLA